MEKNKTAPPAPAQAQLPSRGPSALKVSAKKAQSRRAILAAFCEVVIERGYARATLLETARRAEVDSNAVFKLFPNKRALVFAYYLEKLHEVREMLRDTDAYQHYPLEERLNAFFETLLILHRPHREFIELSSAVVRYSPLSALNGHLQVKAAAREIFDELIQEAADIDELADHRLFRHLPTLLAQLLQQVFVFWMLDDSPGYEQSSKAVHVGVRALMNTLQDRRPFEGISRDSIPLPPFLASAMNMRRLLRSLLLSGMGPDGGEDST